MKVAIAIGAVFAAFLTPTNGYAVVADPRCDGISVCDPTTIIGDSETAILGDNGEVLQCLFGQTGVVVDSNGFCNTPCEGREVFNCTCATESQKETGLAAEAYIDQLIGILALVLIFIAAFFHGYFERSYRKKVDAYQEQLDAAKGDETKIDMFKPNPPRTCCYLIVYLVAFILMIIGFVRMSQILNRDYWVGCGTDGDGFFEEAEVNVTA